MDENTYQWRIRNLREELLALADNVDSRCDFLRRQLASLDPRCVEEARELERFGAMIAGMERQIVALQEGTQ